MSVAVKKMKCLVLEPYYGGSHRAFIEGLGRHLPVDWDLITLPARKWKWRMRLSAPYFAQKLQKRSGDYRSILCSTFVDVATLRALSPAWVRDLPLVTYFHENQFAYPVQVEDKRDYHFALTNYTTALASDRVLFNSRHNLETFTAGCRDLSRAAPGMGMDEGLEGIARKAVICPPGIDFTAVDQAPAPEHENPDPVIVWNHRWEHDKNPKAFFETLFGLDRQGVDFRLIVLGQSFRDCPEIFEEARRRLDHRILHFGTVKTRKEYGRWLKRGDLVISTATHEFFGMAVLEAVRAGCRPLLPDRLSYPENFPEEFLYEEGAFSIRLLEDLAKGRLSPDRARDLTERFSWASLSGAYAVHLNIAPSNQI